jgi:hypothetical protein
VRHPEPYFAREISFPHLRNDGIVHGQQAMGFAEELFAVARQLGDLILVTLEQHQSKRPFQTHDLLAHGSLAAIDHLGRGGHPAGFGDGNEGSKQGGVEVSHYLNL